MNIVCLVRAYNFLLFTHLTTFLSVPLLLLLMFRDIIWYSVIDVVNGDTNAKKSGKILFRWIFNFSWWHNRQVTFFAAPADSILCLCVMNRLHCIPLAIHHFLMIKNKLLGTLLHHTNVTLRGKELNTREVSMEEKIHWYFHTLPPQDPFSVPKKNQTLKLVFLWPIRVYLADVSTGVDIPWHAPFRDTNDQRGES